MADETKVTTTTASTTTTAAKVATPVSKRVVYVGPSILRLGLPRGTVFIDGMPDLGPDVLAKVPAVGQLFVPVDRVLTALKEADTTGSALNVIGNALRGAK